MNNPPTISYPLLTPPAPIPHQQTSLLNKLFLSSPPYTPSFSPHLSLSLSLSVSLSLSLAHLFPFTPSTCSLYPTSLSPRTLPLTQSKQATTAHTLSRPKTRPKPSYQHHTHCYNKQNHIPVHTFLFLAK